MLKELSENYKEHHGSYRNLMGTTVAWKKDIETMNKMQEIKKNKISEMKNTLEGIKSRLDEPDDWITELEDKVEINIQ